MMRQHWHNPAFWRWWWHEGASSWARSGAFGLLALLLVGAGIAFARYLPSASASPGTYTYVRYVTIVHHSRISGRRQVPQDPVTATVTRTLTMTRAAIRAAVSCVCR